MVSDLNDGKIVGCFNEKELQKTSQEKFWVEKILKRKAHKLYVRWKGYDDSINSWVDKKDLK